MSRRRPLDELYLGSGGRRSNRRIGYHGSRRWAPPMLAKLNDQQRRLARCLDGPVLALAGPGTGKTETIVRRIAWAIESGHTPPSAILATTFTQDAAAEMRARIGALVGARQAEAITITTLNSLGWMILRRDQKALGFERVQLSMSLARDIITELVEKLGLSDDEAREIDPAAITERIAAFKTLFIAPADAAAAWPAIAARVSGRDPAVEAEEDPFEDPASDTDRDTLSWRVAASIFEDYVRMMREEDAVDFADQCSLAVALLRDHPDVRLYWQERYSLVLVDEFQDTDPAQWALIRLVAGEGRDGSLSNLCCIGDDDQTLYPWRLAEVTHITEFERWYPEAEVIQLEVNYRSGSAIVAAASRLIGHNLARRPKTLRAADGRPPGQIDRLEAATPQGLATLIARDIISRGGSAGRMLTARTNRMAGVAAGVLAAHGLRVANTTPLVSDVFEHALAAARLASEAGGLADAIVAAGMLPNLDPKLFQRARKAQAAGDGLEQLIAAAVNDTEIAALEGLQRAIRALGDEAGSDADVASRFQAFWTEADVRWRQMPVVQTPDAKAVLSGARGKASLEEWLDTVEGCLSQSDDADIRVMTGHGSKGLEEDEVYLFDWTDGAFPTDTQAARQQIEDERRVAFVMLTRARHRAILCHRIRKPSRFVGEALDTGDVSPGALGLSPAATQDGRTGHALEKPADAADQDALDRLLAQALGLADAPEASEAARMGEQG